MPFNFDNIKNDHVDVDFRAEAKRLNKSTGFTGLGEQAEYFSAIEDTIDLIPRSQWKQISDEQHAINASGEYLVTRIYDQGKEGACCSNATAGASEFLQAKQFGTLNVIPLSAISLYKRVANSPSTGSTLSDNIDEASVRGILPLSTTDNKAKFSATMSNTGFYSSFPSGWQNVAKKFRITEYHIVRSIEGLVTALLIGLPVIVGRDGHSIYYTSVAFKGEKMYALFCNSWGLGWGVAAGNMSGGFGADSEAMMLKSAKYAVVPRVVTIWN